MSAEPLQWEAQAHHDATARRLAWERYMAENDPPSNGGKL